MLISKKFQIDWLMLKSQEKVPICNMGVPRSVHNKQESLLAWLQQVYLPRRNITCSRVGGEGDIPVPIGGGVPPVLSGGGGWCVLTAVPTPPPPGRTRDAYLERTWEQRLGRDLGPEARVPPPQKGTSPPPPNSENLWKHKLLSYYVCGQ